MSTKKDKPKIALQGEGTWGYDEGKKLYWWKLRANRQNIVRKSRTKEGLKKKVLAVKNELEASGRAPTKDERSWTLQAWVSVWLEVYVKPHRRPATYRFYEQMTRLYIVPALGGKKLRSITTTDCQMAINHVTLPEESGGLGLGVATARHVRTVFGILLRKAKALGYLVKVPTQGTTAGEPQESTRRSLPPEMIPAVIAEALRTRELKTKPGRFVRVHRYGALVAFLLATGIRIGEALALKVGDVTLLEQPTVRVDKNLDWQNGWWSLEPTKTKKGKRTLPLSPDALKAIMVQLNTLKADEAKNRFYLTFGFLFADATGSPLVERNIQRSLDLILRWVDSCEDDESKKLGHYSLHELRHTFATILARKGVPLHVLQSLLGHENAATTAKYYVHTFADDMQEAVGKLDFNEGETPKAPDSQDFSGLNAPTAADTDITEDDSGQRESLPTLEWVVTAPAPGWEPIL